MPYKQVIVIDHPYRRVASGENLSNRQVVLSVMEVVQMVLRRQFLYAARQCVSSKRYRLLISAVYAYVVPGVS